MKTIKSLKLISVSLVLHIVMIIVGCGKKVENVNKDYLGTWVHTFSGGMRMETLLITNDKDSEVKTCENNTSGTFCIAPAGATATCYECTGNGSGRTRIKGNKLRIGTTKFEIDQEPIYGSSGMYMILDGKTYSKTSTDGSCNDGIQNQNETGVDCGGLCTACQSCSDNIKNQNETGVDCGGSNCDDCFTSFVYKISAPLGGGTSTYTASVVDASYNGTTFKIKVDQGSTYQSLLLEFNATTTGTFQFNNASYVVPGGSFGVYYYDPGFGSITITSLDLTTKKMSATFNFIGKNAGAMSPASPLCHVTASSFTNLKFYSN